MYNDRKHYKHYCHAYTRRVLPVRPVVTCVDIFVMICLVAGIIAVLLAPEIILPW